ncbi:MAG: endopeptidase La [Lachnospiraceae bacterium]|nr:endopeptidase La [Lachnospiraceae bacterium]
MQKESSVKNRCMMPMVALRGMTLLPNNTAHFDISRKESIEAVKIAMATNQYLMVVTQLDKDNSKGLELDSLQPVGCIVKVRQMVKIPKNVVRVLVEGESRGKLCGIAFRDSFYEADVELWKDTELSKEQEEAYCTSLLEEIRNCYEAGMKINPVSLKKIAKIKQVAVMIDTLAEQLPISYEKRQQILNTEDLLERLTYTMKLLKSEAEVTMIRKELQEQIKGIVEKNQREYVLREQQKLIQEELGEKGTSEIEEYWKSLEKLHAPEEVIEKLSKEIRRLESIPVTSSESTVVRNYVETLLEYPWSKKTEDCRDLKQAEMILNRDHYGMEKVKERVLDFLAVRNMVSEGNSPIICLVGPPGTGKTSIARSIATAVNKEYVRISLGGVRDEAEIRGHRKTYIGAMPGRIATAMMKSGVTNPLMLLDEVDKLSSDYKGDPSSALLEVLDAEQNCKFVDHFFEIPIDLSQVMFLATANDASMIPKPLLDRMEIIEVSSYTQNEKFHIAKEFLVEKQRKKHGLKAKQIQIEDAVLNEIIEAYTRAAGVRGLERQIATLCRKADRVIAGGERKSLRVTSKNMKDFLGVSKYQKEDWDLEPKVGIVTGLAWTSVGGDTLSVEVNIMPGSGKLELTGNLGDVMKESAQIAISCIRSMENKDFLKKQDIHIHVPEGATPKDGPSAGITMATAIYSAVTNQKVRGDIAMTGEVTLRGRVLPIGGLKEKLLAAKNHGMKEVLVPIQNKKDISELSDEILGTMQITYVTNMQEVLERAIVK